MLDLRPQELALVRAILRRRLPDSQVWAFGSRVSGRAKPHSDLDLAIVSSSPVPLATLAEIEEDFSESDLPFRVDLVDWATAPKRFRVRIGRCYEVLLA